MILFPYLHHNTYSPYKASGPIFIHKNVKTAFLKINEILTMFTHRLLSVRGYDKNAMTVDPKTVYGTTLFDTIQHLFFDNPDINLHIHNANPGCYNCLIDHIH